MLKLTVFSNDRLASRHDETLPCVSKNLARKVFKFNTCQQFVGKHRYGLWVSKADGCDLSTLSWYESKL